MAATAARGRYAESPMEVPAAGWRDIAWRVKSESTADHVSIVAAGVAFFGLLAIFPGIAALVSIGGLLLDPATVEAQLANALAFLPENASAILKDQAAAVASSGETKIGLAALAGLSLTFYSASKGMKTLMEGMNIAYDETEDRGFFMLNLTAFALTLIAIAGVVIALLVVVGIPAVLNTIGLSSGLTLLIDLGRWIVLALLTIFGLALIYRYGPSRADPQWQWVTPGALIATVLWVIGSIAFSLYVSYAGTYNETYGALGGVIILLTWLWLTAFIVLMGAELNSEMEHQTKKDTTTGDPAPMGERGAIKADTLGDKP